MKLKLFHSIKKRRKNNELKTIKTYSPKNILFQMKKLKLKNCKLNLDMFSFDEEYVSKLKYYNSELNINGKKETLCNVNTLTHLPNIFKQFQINVNDNNKHLEDKKIISKINIKKQIFEKKIYDNMEHTRYIGRLENMFKESVLEKKRNELEIKINKIKDLMDSLSKELSDTLAQIEDLKIDIEIFKNYKSCAFLDKILQKQNLDDNSFEKAIKIKKGKEFEKRIIKEMMKSKRKSIIEENKINSFEKIKMLNNKKNNILDKLESCDRDLREFKEKHTIIKNDLLLHYHKLLLEGRDTRKDGLCWIIKSIWNLKSNVIMSFLPKFLDVESISFLFLYTDKLVEIEKIQKKIEKINNVIKNREKKTKKLAYLSNMILNNDKGDKYLNYMNLYNKNKKSIHRNINKENHKSNNKNMVKHKQNINSKSDITVSRSNIKVKSVKLNDILLSPHHDENDENIVNKKKIKRFFSQPDISLNNENWDNIIKKKAKKKNSNFEDTFKTSLYKANSLNENNSNISNISETGNNSSKNKINIVNRNLKNIFFEPEYLPGFTTHISPKKKITIKDYENIKIFKIEDSFDSELLNLFNTHKDMIKKLKNMKNEADKLARKELDRVGKCFYLEDYKSKYNTNLKIVVGALIGEDNIRNELLRQEKEQKEYFKTIKNIRNFNGFYNKKYM